MRLSARSYFLALLIFILDRQERQSKQHYSDKNNYQQGEGENIINVIGGVCPRTNQQRQGPSKCQKEQSQSGCTQGNSYLVSKTVLHLRNQPSPHDKPPQKEFAVFLLYSCIKSVSSYPFFVSSSICFSSLRR